MLAKRYGWIPRFEPVDNNPYLDDYYGDLPRWAFNLEVYFLKQRFRDLLEITRSDNDIIQDRSIFEGVYVFAANNYAMGNLSERDFETYMELFESMMTVVKVPDLKGNVAATYTLTVRGGEVSVETDSAKPYTLIVHR